MNFDFLEASKSLDKDKICLDHLDHEASYSSGWQKFIYEGCKAIEIWMNPDTDKLKIKGSIPYFITGQNFKTSSEDFEQGIDHISEVLNLDIRQAEVNVFEFGTTLSIQFPAKEIFTSHIKIRGMRSRAFDHGKYFDDRVLRLKLYDAGKNIKNKLTKEERQKLSNYSGYDPFQHYLKIENHYKKPQVCFKRSLLLVDDLMKPEFQTICKEDLLKKYQSIMKSNSFEIKSKKQVTSSTIPLLLLKEFEGLLPCKAEDLIRQKIKSFPAEILSKEDKKSRVRQIRANLRKIETVRSCQYDISEILMNQILSSES